MKLFFVVAEDKIRQVSSPENAACLRFLGQKDCRLFEFDTDPGQVVEVGIPDIAFREVRIGD